MFLCCEYESGYDSEYEGGYDINFVYYDEDELEDEESSDCYEEDEEYEDYDSDDDIVFEEIPSLYCPSWGEIGEA